MTTQCDVMCSDRISIDDEMFFTNSSMLEPNLLKTLTHFLSSHEPKSLRAACVVVIWFCHLNIHCFTWDTWRKKNNYKLFNRILIIQSRKIFRSFDVLIHSFVVLLLMHDFGYINHHWLFNLSYTEHLYKQLYSIQ